MEYTVHLDAQVGVLSRDEDLSDRLLTALEEMETKHRLAAPVTSQNAATGIVGATFCVSALDAGGGAALAASLFQEALQDIGVATPAHLESLQVEEDHEEAAALG